VSGFPRCEASVCSGSVASVAEPTGKTFIVESYVPQLNEQAAAARTASLCAAVRRLNEAGVTVRLLRSLALVDEETHLCLVAARELGDVIQLGEQAGLAPDYVAEAITIGLQQ
jgi:hypothetical protein